MTILYHLTVKCNLGLQSIWTNVSNGTSTPQGEQLCQIIFKSMQTCRSYVPDKLILWPFHHLTSSVTLTFNLPKQMFQVALLLLKENNCAKLVWNPCTNVQGMTRTSLDRHRHIQCMHASLRTYQTEVVTVMSCSPQGGSTKAMTLKQINNIHQTRQI